MLKKPILRIELVYDNSYTDLCDIMITENTKDRLISLFDDKPEVLWQEFDKSIKYLAGRLEDKVKKIKKV